MAEGEKVEEKKPKHTERCENKKASYASISSEFIIGKSIMKSSENIHKQSLVESKIYTAKQHNIIM